MKRTVWEFTCCRPDPTQYEAVFYLDITESDVERASELFGKALHSLDRFQAEKGLVTSTQY